MNDSPERIEMFDNRRLCGCYRQAVLAVQEVVALGIYRVYEARLVQEVVAIRDRCYDEIVARGGQPNTETGRVYWPPA